MRHLTLTAIAFGALMGAPGFAAPDPQAPAATPSPTASATGRVQTTDQANSQSIQSAAQAPLRDLNVVRTKIPPVLLDALADPYNRPPGGPRQSKKAQCAELIELIKPLDEALGADLDNPSKDARGLMDKGRETAFGAAASFASDAIPFHDWVRKLTGAEQHDKTVQGAITAGGVRRGYLKGLGEARGCDPPATPSHALTAMVAQKKEEEAADPRRFKPRYPVR